MELLTAIGAEQVAGRVIYRGKDLAFWNVSTQDWDVTDDGIAFIAAHNARGVDGTEVIIPAEAPARRTRRARNTEAPTDIEVK